MRKTLFVLIAAALIFSVPALTHGANYYEEYTGSQLITEGNSYWFKFDMWQTNDFDSGTNSSLHLTTDVAGAFGAYTAGKVFIHLSSIDSEDELVGVKLTAFRYDSEPFQTIDLGIVSFNANWDSPDYFHDFVLTSAALDAFDNWGWGSVAIKAESMSGGINNFWIEEVGLGVCTAVPEPMSLLLLGLGLLGLGAVRRKN